MVENDERVLAGMELCELLEEWMEFLRGGGDDGGEIEVDVEIHLGGRHLVFVRGEGVLRVTRRW